MLTKKTAIAWLNSFTNEIVANKQLLSELDNAIGDGDHGHNMARGLEAYRDALQAKEPETLQDVFKLVAMTLLSKVGGASGPLYSTAFLQMAKAVNGRDSLSYDEVTDLINTGLQGLLMRGKAVFGEKTMIDVWDPVVKALATHSLTEESIEKTLQDTKSRLATKGRASYLGERSIGHLDPGSYSSALFFKCMLRTGVLQ